MTTPLVEIDPLIAGGSYAGKPQLGVVEVAGNTLRLALAEPGSKGGFIMGVCWPRLCSGSVVSVTAFLMLSAAGARETTQGGGQSEIARGGRSVPENIALPRTPTLRRQGAFLCAVGRFRIEGGPLIAPRDAAADVVSLIDSHVSIDGLCPATLATLDPRPDGTWVTARWRACPALPHGARLTARIDAGSCSNLEGSFHAPGVVARRDVRAQLVRCDEHAEQDGREPEECDPLDRLALSFQRWRTHFVPRSYPNGIIAKDALNTANAQIALAPIALDRWFSIGPAPIIGAYDGDSQSGRVNALAIDPSDLSHWLLGAASGGVWETMDSGATWHPRTDDQPSLAMSAIAFAPGSPSVVYAGMGNRPTMSSDLYPGAGLLKSQDGGHTWTLVAADTFAGLSVPSLRVSNIDSDDVVAATTSDPRGVFGKPAPAGAQAPGVYRSSDGGAGWSLTLGGEATDLTADPTDFMRQYAALRSKTWSEQFTSSEPLPPGWQSLLGGGVFRSLDGGEHWTSVAGPWNVPPGQTAEILLALAPSEPGTLYVSVRGPIDKNGAWVGLWVTRNAWAPTPAWSKVSQNGLLAGGYPVGPNHVISVHPADPGIVYGGGLFLWKLDKGTWSDIGKTANTMYVDQNALAWAGTRLLVGNDGGVFSHDETAGGPWANHNTNLAITQLYGGASHPAVPGAMIAGAQDNGVVKRVVASPPAWTEILGGDGMGAQPGSVAGHWIYWTQNLGLRRSLDDSVTHKSAQQNIADYSLAPWLARVVRCAANADVVLAGTTRLWRTDSFFSAPENAAVAIIPWAANGPAVDTSQTGLHGFVSAIAFAPSDPTCQTYAFGADKGQLLLTTDAGAHWVDLDPTNKVPGRYVTGLAFSSTSADTLYVTLSGFDEGTPGKPGHVFKATGATTKAAWTNVSPPANLPANVVATHPILSNIVYVGTDLGLWVSSDGGGTWAHAGPASGLPNVPIFGIDFDACGETVFTFGRGAFRHAVPLVCQ